MMHLVGTLLWLTTAALAQETPAPSADPAASASPEPTPSVTATPSASPSPAADEKVATSDAAATTETLGAADPNAAAGPKGPRAYVEFFDPTGKPVPNDWPTESQITGSGKNRKVELYFWMPKNFEWFPAPDSPLVAGKVPKNVKSLNPARKLNQAASFQGTTGDPLAMFREKGKSEIAFMMRIKVEEGDLGGAVKPGFNLGAALDFANYSEQPFNVSTTQVGIALFGDYMKPVHPKWRLIGAFRITALPLSLASSNLPLARYFGVGAQASYALDSMRMMGLEWRIGLGPILWGMLVPNSAYGVSTVFGPQLIFSGASREISSNYKAMALRIAYLGSGIDIRARYETLLFASEGTRPWFLFYEAAYASFSNPTQGNSFTLIYGTAGVRISFSKLEKTENEPAIK